MALVNNELVMYCSLKKAVASRRAFLNAPITTHPTLLVRLSML
jgi:hypothetical protein